MTFRDLLDELKVAYLESGSSHCRPGWIQLRDCVFCSSTNYHLGYRLGSRYTNCWRCGFHPAYVTLQRLGASKAILGQFWKGLEHEHVAPREAVRGKLIEPKGRGPLKRIHKEYLCGRGYKPEQVQGMWEIEGIGIAGRLGWRIYIPIYYQNRRVSWTTRAVGSDVAQRYISAGAEEEAVNHKRILYGLDYCAQSVVICEGPLDVWKVGPGSVGVFGTSYTPAQVRLLSGIPFRFVCFDSSKEAQREARKLAGELAVFPGRTENVILDAKDPGEAKPKEIAALRRLAGL